MEEEDDSLDLFQGHTSKIVNAIKTKMNKTALTDLDSNLNKINTLLSHASKTLNCKEDAEARSRMEARFRILSTTSLHSDMISQELDKTLNQQTSRRVPLGKEFIKNLANAKMGEVEKHNFYRRFLLITKTNSNNDDDVEVMQEDGANQDQRFCCPLSGQLMKIPVRNSACGHFYDEKSLQHISKSCPVRGCSIPFVASNVKRSEEKALEIEEYLDTLMTKKKAPPTTKMKKKIKMYSQDDDDDDVE